MAIDPKEEEELFKALEDVRRAFESDAKTFGPSYSAPLDYRPSYYLLDDKDVHTEHCCEEHKACKYMDLDCTVATGQKKASYPCNCDHF
jgi:hypothetical protein